MTYAVLSPQPTNLQAHEVAVNLSDLNADVAVFVEVLWQANNAGAVFHARARAINADGTSQACPCGNPVQTEARALIHQADIQAYGADALKKEIAQLMLGEPPTLVTATNPDGSTFQRRLIDVSDDALMGWSIRHALAVVGQAGPVTDLGSLL